MLQLGRECIILEMEAVSKEEALRELAAAVHAQCKSVDANVLFQALQEREQVGSTGVGNGIAIPHAKVAGIEQLVLCFGRSKRGISFEAIDNRPVHIFVQILSPVGMAGTYLQSLARISRLLKSEDNRRVLLESEQENEILTLFNGWERES